MVKGQGQSQGIRSGFWTLSSEERSGSLRTKDKKCRIPILEKENFAFFSDALFTSFPFSL